jgi:hypothetical protein
MWIDFGTFVVLAGAGSNTINLPMRCAALPDEYKVVNP